MKTFSLIMVMLVALVAPVSAEAPSDWEHSVMTEVERPYSLAVSPDGKLLAVACMPASSSESGRIVIMHLAEGHVEQVVSGALGSQMAKTLYFSADNRILYVPNMVADSYVVAWDVASREPMATVSKMPFSGYSETVAVNPDFSSTSPMLVAEHRSGFVQFYGDAGQPLGEPVFLGFDLPNPSSSSVDRAAFSFLGRYVALASHENEARLAMWSYAGGKWSFDLVPEKEVVKLPGVTGGVAVSPNGEIIAIATSVGVALLRVNIEKKSIVSQPPLNGDGIYGVGFLPDSRLVTAGTELAIHDLNAKTKVSLASFNKLSGGIKMLAVSSDGTAIYGIVDRQVHIWRRKEASTGVNTGSVQKNP